MFCQKCGNQLNEGALFCPKCGTKLASGNETNQPFQQNNNYGPQMASNGVKNTSDNNKTINGGNIPKKRNNTTIIIIAVIAVLFLIILLKACSSIGKSSANTSNSQQVNNSADSGGASKQQNETEPDWLEQNRGRGASSPHELAEIFIEALDMHLVSTLDKYWDAEQDIIGTPMETYFNTYYNKWQDEHTERIKLDTVTYDTSEDTAGNISIKIDFEEENGGLGSVVIMMHKNSTPDGERWFLGPEDHSRE